MILLQNLSLFRNVIPSQKRIQTIPVRFFSFGHRLTRLDLLRLSRIFIWNLSGSAYRINPYQGANVPNDMSLLQSKESTDINPRCLPDPLHQFLCLNIRWSDEYHNKIQFHRCANRTKPFHGITIRYHSMASLFATDAKLFLSRTWWRWAIPYH